MESPLEIPSQSTDKGFLSVSLLRVEYRNQVVQHRHTHARQGTALIARHSTGNIILINIRHYRYLYIISLSILYSYTPTRPPPSHNTIPLTSKAKRKVPRPNAKLANIMDRRKEGSDYSGNLELTRPREWGPVLSLGR